MLNSNLNVIGGFRFAPDVVTPEVFYCTETPDPLIFSRRHLPQYQSTPIKTAAPEAQKNNEYPFRDWKWLGPGREGKVPCEKKAYSEAMI